MNIVFTVDSMNSGGAERVVSILANNFAKSGNKVTIVMVSYGVQESFYELDNHVRLESIVKDYNNKVNPFKRVGLLKKRLVSINPDIVLAFLPHVCIYTWLALKSTTIPFICSERNDPNRMSPLYKLLSRIAFSKSTACVFQTNDAMKWYGKKIAKKSTVIFNPVIIQTNLCTSNKSRTIISVGRLTKQKNFKFLINSFSLFLKNKPDFKLIIYGEGPLKKQLILYSKKKRVQKSVFFAGNSKTWHSEGKQASMFVSSSNYEGMPNALEEALAIGIPCIATDCPIGGSRELMTHFENDMFLIKSMKPQKMASMMEKRLNTASISVDLLERKRALLSPESISKQWMSFINDFVTNS